MAKDAYTKAVEKQAKEQKKYAEAAARREQAKAIIDGQKMINGFRIMDENSEIFLTHILEKYDGNKKYSVVLEYEEIPQVLQHSISLELEKLKMYGVITSYLTYITGGHIYLSLNGIKYFENKDKVLKGQNEFENIKPTRKEFDLFLSHANADKLNSVDELYSTLSLLKINIFYDKEELSWGDNWKDRLLQGVDKSEFAIIVISKEFFGREWTEKELNEFLQRQNTSGQKIILPLLYGIDYQDVKKHYPDLEYIQSLKAEDNSIEKISILFAKELIKRYK
ncbi:MAG: toll/interleukin-1 receptor domain-containing protein [Ruminococcus sp.]|nr:toll/interleukin-1 receptor domain-containing protein [Ruminococcus sp.]